MPQNCVSLIPMFSPMFRSEPSAIACGVNICGLVLEDPEHTIHLQTMLFAASTKSAPEIDELA